MDRLRSFFVMIVVGVGVAVLLSPVFFARMPSLAFAQTAAANPNAAVAAAVQSYFADIPIMVAIARCESGPRQFAASGAPLLGGTGTMVGIFQIDETIHRAPALALGFDINTVQGNMSYARYLYGAEGTEPWLSSFACWGAAAGGGTSISPASPGASSASGNGATSPSGTSTSAAGASASSSAGVVPALTRDLSLGDADPQVLVLQRTLNASGFLVAASGPGSPENETTMFGSLTRAALERFQCAQGIACSGDEATTGYGFLNAATRAALLAYAPPDTGPVATVAAAGAGSSTAGAATSAAATAADAAETAELQSRLAALVVIFNQLKAELAARLALNSQ